MRDRRAGRCLISCAVLLFVACTTTIEPPATPSDPVAVYLLDHGRTPSLVLPVDDAGGEPGMLRYAYGDWRWYALEQKSSGQGVAALLWPTRGALGREAIPGPPGEAAVRAGVEVPIETLHPVLVGAAEVAALAARLDALFESEIDTLVEAPGSGLSFVHHPEPYTFLHSSNRAVAGWLRELGCRVRGTALWSSWRVAPAPAGAPDPSATMPPGRGDPPPPAPQETR
ncbi:MAG TPA: hypothetical protein VHM02_10305 [Thermoanaerobaculia bacterium]|nr:hypothetical protein [Thermoanaerobaculia bacterium]